MRTTIVIEDSLEEKLKGLAERRGLSDFINQCLHEHFAQEERAQRLAELEGAYTRAAAQGGSTSKDFSDIEIEGWPEW